MGIVFSVACDFTRYCRIFEGVASWIASFLSPLLLFWKKWTPPKVESLTQSFHQLPKFVEKFSLIRVSERDREKE